MNFSSNKLPAIIEAMLYIHYNDMRGDAVQPLGGKKLAEIMQLNPRYLEPLLQNLVKNMVLHSSKGARGGYSLLIAAGELTVAQICSDAVGCEDKLREEKLEFEQSLIRQNIIIPVFQQAENAYNASLADLSLQDLYQQIIVKKLDNLLKQKLSDGLNNSDFNYAI